MPQHEPRPGGIAVIGIDLPASFADAPLVTFAERRALVLKQGEAWLAVVGIPLDQQAGTVTLHVSSTNGGAPVEMPFEVLLHEYPEQRLTVERAYVDPSPVQLERILRERKIIDSALGNWREASLADVLLQPPVPGQRSPSFGFRRVFNDDPALLLAPLSAP